MDEDCDYAEIGRDILESIPGTVQQKALVLQAAIVALTELMEVANDLLPAISQEFLT